jgi:5-methylthioribose kinase
MGSQSSGTIPLELLRDKVTGGRMFPHFSDRDYGTFQCRSVLESEDIDMSELEHNRSSRKRPPPGRLSVLGEQF